MKKPVKLSLAIVVTIALYIGLYYMLIVNAAPEDYATNIATFWGSLMFAVIGIPIGALLTWFLEKKNLEKSKSTIIVYAVAHVWGFLFSWLSLTGMIIGQYIVEKESKTASKFSANK